MALAASVLAQHDPAVTTATIRADPQNRPQRRTRRSFGIWRDIKAAWWLTLAAWRRRPLLFAVALVIWALVRFACLRKLGQAHLGLGGTLSVTQAASLAALALTADLGPVVLAALLWPAQHRIMLASPRVSLAAAAARAARMLGVAFAFALCGAAIINLPLVLPGILLPAIGRVSTILTLILLLPGAGLGVVWLLRLSFGLPAISLGLPRALAEGWDISRHHVARALCVWLGACLPLMLVFGECMAARLDAVGWAETLVRPVLDVAAVSLTGSLTGLFYRDMRLPLGLRPDVRPSWNPRMRREPMR
jgi:hypothetical protein